MLVGFDTTLISGWIITAARSNKPIFHRSCFQYDRTRARFSHWWTFLRDFTCACSSSISWTGLYSWCSCLSDDHWSFVIFECIFKILYSTSWNLELLSCKSRFIKLDFAGGDRLLLLKSKDQESKQQFPLTC